MRASTLAGHLGERAALIAGHVAQHLYVNASDLKAQDEIQKHVEELAAENARDGKALATLLAGTPAEDEMTKFAAIRTEFVKNWTAALAASREETVSGSEDREKSRALYTDEGRAAERRPRSGSERAPVGHRQVRQGHGRRGEGGCVQRRAADRHRRAAGTRRRARRWRSS